MSASPAYSEPSSPEPLQHRLGVSRATALLFASTLFVSAFLLFQVQLIVSKYILPWFGGSASVWTTSMLVFQALLLGGYVYSHLVSTRLSKAAQTRLHLAFLSIAFLLLLIAWVLWPSPITPGPSWLPKSGSSPVAAVAATILVAAGFPFLVLSTTGPLLQSWFARLGGGVKTYKLYSVSNLGSLLGLLTFPFLFEPVLHMRTQSYLWCALFVFFLAGCGICAIKALAATGAEPSLADKETLPETRPNPLVYCLWFLLPACASSLLLATTNLLCQETTTVPLLWVLPLSIYLLTFILCFDHPRWYQRAVFHPLYAVSMLLTCAVLIYARFLLQLALLPILLFVTCMICHGELIRLKPGVKRLTTFYLAISAGGVAGGIFVAVVAPHLFTFFTEFQLTLGVSIVLLLTCLFLDPSSWIFEGDFRLPIFIMSAGLLAIYCAALWLPQIATHLKNIHFYTFALLGTCIVAVGAYLKPEAGTGSGFRFVQIPALAIAILTLIALGRSTRTPAGLYFSERNFYGTTRVFSDYRGKTLMHGQTLHGAQIAPPYDRGPTLYFGPSSGVGVVLQNHPSRTAGTGKLRVGVVGLGVGTLAVYGQPGDDFRFYEINPSIVKLSTGPNPVFTYLRDSAASVDVVLGDARLLLAEEVARGEKQKFDILILDAFAGDALPVHLLTREAFETYWQLINQANGVIAVNITSRHVNLLPVLQGAAEYFHADSVVKFNKGTGAYFNSCWVLLSRKPGVLNMPGLKQVFPPNAKRLSPQLWTDDYSNVMRLLQMHVPM